MGQREYAFKTLLIKAYIDRIELVNGEQVVASHKRCRGRNQWMVDPLHYLAALERRPAALDHAPVYRHWQLPPEMTRLRDQLEAELGQSRGCRQYVRILKLLFSHPVERVLQAVERCQPLTSADAVIRSVERLARHPSTPTQDVRPFNHQREQNDPQVPMPDLNQYNLLIPQHDYRGALS